MKHAWIDQDMDGWLDDGSIDKDDWIERSIQRRITRLMEGLLDRRIDVWIDGSISKGKDQ